MEGMKTDLITTKAKQKNIYIEKKVIKKAELTERTKKKKKPRTTTTNKRWGQSALINLKEQQEGKNLDNLVLALCSASVFHYQCIFQVN